MVVTQTASDPELIGSDPFFSGPTIIQAIGGTITALGRLQFLWGSTEVHHDLSERGIIAVNGRPSTHFFAFFQISPDARLAALWGRRARRHGGHCFTGKTPVSAMPGGQLCGNGPDPLQSSDRRDSRPAALVASGTPLQIFGFISQHLQKTVPGELFSIESEPKVILQASHGLGRTGIVPGSSAGS